MDELKTNKLNFVFLTMEGTFFFFGLTFLDANTVIPVFIDSFTGSLQIAGLANTLRLILTLLPQLLIGPYVSNIKNLPSFIFKVMIIFRPLFLLMVPILISNPGSKASVILFLIIYSLFWLCEGIISIPWWELFSRTISNDKRGKLLGCSCFSAALPVWQVA